jgi:membrane protein DedA with SNARE-associated domain
MNSLLDNLGQLVLNYPDWSHAILGLGIILQGEITIFVAMYLVVSRNLTWWEYIWVSVGTLFVAETFMYFVARVMRNTRFGWRIYRRLKPNRRIQTYTYYLKTNMKKIFIVAKFLPGTNLIILLLTGWAKVRLGDFLRSYLASLFLWFSGMTVVAYFLMSGLHYLKSARVFHQVELVIAGVIILVIGGEHVFRKMVQKAVSIDEKAREIGEFVEEKIEKREEDEK